MGVWQTVHKNERHKKRKLYLFTFNITTTPHHLLLHVPSSSLTSICLFIWISSHLYTRIKTQKWPNSSSFYSTACDTIGAYTTFLWRKRKRRTHKKKTDKNCEKYTLRDKTCGVYAMCISRFVRHHCGGWRRSPHCCSCYVRQLNTCTYIIRYTFLTQKKQREADDECREKAPHTARTYTHSAHIARESTGEVAKIKCKKNINIWAFLQMSRHVIFHFCV